MWSISALSIFTEFQNINSILFGPPEIENTDVLNDDMHINYQILINMLVWICVIIRAEVAHATSSLSLFTVL